MKLGGWLFLAGTLTFGLPGLFAAFAMPIVGVWFLASSLPARNRWWAAGPSRASLRARLLYTVRERDDLALHLMLLAAPGVLAGPWSLVPGGIGLVVIPGSIIVYTAANHLRRGEVVSRTLAGLVLGYAALVAVAATVAAAVGIANTVDSGGDVVGAQFIVVLGALWVIPSVIAAWKLWVVVRTRETLVLPSRPVPPPPDPASPLPGPTSPLPNPGPAAVAP